MLPPDPDGFSGAVPYPSASEVSSKLVMSTRGSLMPELMSCFSSEIKGEKSVKAEVLHLIKKHNAKFVKPRET